jgi:hypothetical protein
MKSQMMTSSLPKSLLLGLTLSAASVVTACGARMAEGDDVSSPLAINVSNRRAISEVTSPTHAGTYAKSHDYYSYAANQLKAGMKVMFSVSYGSSGGEAGQARGVLVDKDGGLFFEQQENTTNQMLLPPGLAWDNGSDGVSLWDMRGYLDLINRVAFSEATAYGDAPNKDVYAQTSAYQVDFEGGTAGGSVGYKDAMELKLEKSNPDSSKSNVSVYFAKGVGAVALEFRETGSVGGTFKLYVGDKLPPG